MRANTVVPRPVDWLWQPYIPLGKITSVAGQMGQAKSLLTAWLAAYTTQRGGSVIVLAAEDDPEDTVRPRLEAAGADLERVEIAEFHTLDAVRLNELADGLGNVQLVTIDPVQAFMPAGTNSWKGQDVRIALEPIRLLAAHRRLAAVLIQHLNRRTDGDPLARIADSHGIPQLARSVLVWGPDPSDPDGDRGTHKALSAAKANLARGATPSATFQIRERAVTGDLTAPYLHQGADTQLTAGDLVADQDTRTAITEAKDWLAAVLAHGPVAKKTIEAQAKADGLSDMTLRRAKKALHVKADQVRDGNTITGWTWHLPTHSYTPDHLEHVDHLERLDLGDQGVQPDLHAHPPEGSR